MSPKDNLSYFFRMPHCIEEKLCIIFTRSLNFDVAELEKSRQKTIYYHRHVLNLVKTDIRYFTVKNFLLIDNNNAFLGYVPDIKVILGPIDEKRYPDSEKPETVEKKEERACIARDGNIRKLRNKQPYRSQNHEW